VRSLSLSGSLISGTEEHSPAVAAKLITRAQQELSILQRLLSITHPWAFFAT
jgi:hypothetical protein